MSEIRIAIAGIGNCASALIQGLTHYPGVESGPQIGLTHDSLGGWKCSQIEVVAAYDIDVRKVGKKLSSAVFSRPNCTRRFSKVTKFGDTLVEMGPVLDGVAPHMATSAGDLSFRVADCPPVDIVESLQKARAEILICYLPVGSEQAVRAYASACLRAGVALINCVPVFIASDPSWEEQFRAASLPLIGDDVKSQLGATILHRNLATLFADRGVSIDRTYQLNIGGNTDFLNMLDRQRLSSKKKSKTEAVQACLPKPLRSRDIHVGPSDFVPWLRDQKVCYIRLEGRGFGLAPIEVEVKLTVHDSPNSAGVVVDLIRYAKIGLDLGLGGAILPACALYMKSPPKEMKEDVARAALYQLEQRAGG